MHLKQVFPGTRGPTQQGCTKRMQKSTSVTLRTVDTRVERADDAAGCGSTRSAATPTPARPRLGAKRRCQTGKHNHQQGYTLEVAGAAHALHIGPVRRNTASLQRAAPRMRQCGASAPPVNAPPVLRAHRDTLQARLCRQVGAAARLLRLEAVRPADGQLHVDAVNGDTLREGQRAEVRLRSNVQAT